MHAYKIFSFLFISVFMMPYMGYAEVDDSGMERFLNVTQWKGSIGLRVKKTMHHRNDYKGGYSEDRLDSVRNFRTTFKTSDGMVSMVDPFVGEKEPTGGSAINKGDMFEGIDFKQMQAAMQRSGLDTSMIMGQMNKMKGLHISANKYKQWENSQAANTGKLNISGHWYETKFHREEGSDGEGGGRGYQQSTGTTDGAYQGFGSVSLVINLQKQVYSFKWGILERSPQTAKKTFHSGDSDGVREDWTRAVAFENFTKDMWRTVKFESLPNAGLSLMGTKTWRNTGDDGVFTEVTLQWTIVPSNQAVPEPWLEFVKGGEDWLPEKDNQVEAVLRWKDSVSPSDVRFTLYDISQEPGTSLNSKDDNTDLDMEFDKTNEEHRYVITKSDKSFIATKDHLADQSARIILHAKDYGAYGKLKAEIKVNGSWFEATSKTFHLPYIPVPYDKNSNLIADKWEKDNGILDKNLSPNWDEDTEPSAQHSNGDGFTLYEEYRGFQEIAHVFRKGVHEQVKDGHVRMDPMYKDVFIYDQDGLFTQYYKPYNPADLNWHLITPALLKRTGNLESDADYRWVNFNTSKKHFFRNQYAIFIVNKGISSNTELANDVGYNPTVSDCSRSTHYSHPLKCFYSAEIYLDTIHTWASKAPGTKAEKSKYAHDQLTSTVIHELGHAVGIRHHSPKMGQGVKQCAMRYDSDTEMGHPRIFGFLRTRYCKKGETYLTGEADAGGKFKQFPSHNCYGQINTKGD